MSSSSKEALTTRKNRATRMPIQPKSARNPWKAFAGIWRDNPDFDAFLQEIKDARHEADQTDRQPRP